MKNIRITNEHGTRYLNDCLRIVEILKARDLNCSVEQAEILWEKHSDAYCAGWLHLYDDDEQVFDAVKSYFEVVDD